MSTMILNSGDKKIVSPAAESKKSSIVLQARSYGPRLLSKLRA